MKLTNEEKFVAENLDLVIDMLDQEGYDASLVENWKNGVLYRGIRIFRPGENVAPVVYFSEGEKVDTFMANVFMVLSEPYPEFDAEMLLNPEYVLQNIRLGIQKKSDDSDGMIKRTYLNLEAYLKLDVASKEDMRGFVRVTKEHLERIGLSESALWNQARKNTARFNIKSLAEILGIPDEGFSPFDVAKTLESDGACVLLYPEFFEDYCMEKNVDAVYILPSSTEEVLLLPDCGDEIDPADLAVLVQEVNSQEVASELQLQACVYAYEQGSNQVIISASI